MAKLSDSQKKEMFSKYKKKLEKEFNPKEFLEEPEASYSAIYNTFRQEQIGKFNSFYEKACNWSEKNFKITIKESDREKVRQYIEFTHLNVSAEGVYSFSLLMTILVVAVFAIIGTLMFNVLIVLCGAVGALIMFLAMPTIPKQIFNAWRAKASDQIVLAVLYMVIYMEHTANLELAVWFSAKHLPPPLSLDFIKVLWDVETKKFSTIQESLENYIEGWREWDPEFVDSIHLMEAAMFTKSKDEQLKTLEKSVDTLLQGTEDHMLNFAHNLQNPISTLHMLGIILPVMGMVMLPMISAFMGQSVKASYLLLLYDIVLPIAVFGLSKNVLDTRPAGANPTDVYRMLEAKYGKPTVKFGNFNTNLSPGIFSAFLFILIALPASLYFYSIAIDPEIYATEVHSMTALLLSLTFIAAGGFSMGTYYYFKTKDFIKLRKKISKIEEEFAAAIFQLGSKISEGIPTEVAFSKIIEVMPKSDVSDFFKLIDYNIKQGMSLEKAIFDEKAGAFSYYPSALIKSVMQTLIESSKKGPEVAAKSLMTISRYLQAVHRVNTRLLDLLAETTSSMSMQVKMFAPAITGIVVGLSFLTTTIMLNLKDKLVGIESGGAAGAGFGTGILDVFQIDYMIPSGYFQIIVGVYLIQITIIMSYLLSGIIDGPDEIKRNDLLAKNLFMATAFYFIITVACILLFSGLAAPIASGIGSA